MGWGRRRLDQVRAGQRRSEAHRRQLSQRLQAKRQLADSAKAEAQARAAAKRARFLEIDIAAAIDWTRRFAFLPIDQATGPPACLNRPTVELAEAFLLTLRDRTSRAVLQWPLGQSDVSLLHPLSMLALICAKQEQTTNDYTWCPAVHDFRTVYYPWRGTGTGGEQRGILIERHSFLKRNQLHLTRPWAGEPEASPELKVFHEILAHLINLKSHDGCRPHLAHPTLAEIYPTFGALGGEEAPRPFGALTRDLFGRVEHGAGLTRLPDKRAAIANPNTAPFGFFGVCSRADAAKVLAHPALVPEKGGRPPDLCLLDLTPPGLRRLGHGWEHALTDFLEHLRRLDPELPILAVTHDVHIHRRVERLMRDSAAPDRPLTHVHSRVLFRASDEPFTDDPPIGEVSHVAFQFHSVAGNGAAALRVLSAAAQSCSDASRAGRLRMAMGALRRAMSLPCGMNAAYDCLCQTEGQAAAEVFLERRAAGTVIATIKATLEMSESANERLAIEAAERAVRQAYGEFAIDTPIGSLLAETAAAIARKSSRSLIVFNSETERLLGERRLLTDPDIGDILQKKLAAGFIRITSLSALDTAMSELEAAPDRNSWKRLVLVTPVQAQLSILLGRKWLPEELFIVSDREFVVGLASTFRHLANHPDLAGEQRVGQRLAAAAKAAKVESDARDVGPLDLELDARPSGENLVIDLTGDSDDDDGQHEVLEIELESGRKLRIRPGGIIIRHNPFAEINVFERTIARDIEPEDAIVIPDLVFLQEARSLLPVRVLAQGWIDVFHSVVEASLPLLPGETLAAKARHVALELARRGARQATQAAAADWLRVADHKLVPKDQLRPHAPQRWREFDALMDVLGQRTLAEKIWKEGILPLRIDRRRAGVKMAHAFASVLVDPHGGAASLAPEIRAKIAALRRRALEHVDGVIACRLERPREGAGA